MLTLKECIREFERAKEKKRRGMADRKVLAETNHWLRARQAADRKELLDFLKEGWLK